MARVANESANWWVRTVIIGFASIVVAMVGWTLVHIMATADDNARKIVGIETRLGNIEDSIRDLKQ